MKTKTISIYTINELDERAQEKAHHDYLSSGFDYVWLNEGMDSIKAFCADFRVDLVDWSIGTYRRGDSYIETDATQETFRNVRPSDIRRLDVLGANWRTAGTVINAVSRAEHQLDLLAVLPSDLSADTPLRIQGDDTSLLEIYPLPYNLDES